MVTPDVLTAENTVGIGRGVRVLVGGVDVTRRCAAFDTRTNTATLIVYDERGNIRMMGDDVYHEEVVGTFEWLTEDEG